MEAESGQLLGIVGVIIIIIVIIIVIAISSSISSSISISISIRTSISIRIWIIISISSIISNSIIAILMITIIIMVKTPSWQHSLFPDSSPQQRKTPVAKRPEAGSGNPASSVSSGGVEADSGQLLVC